MIDTTQAVRACPLCESRSLTPAFSPPLVRCGECGLVFKNVQGVHAQVREAYDERYSEVALEQRVQDRRRFVYREFLTRYRPVPGRNRLLDVGCGTGQFLILAKAEGWDVTGVEIAEAGAASARAAGLRVVAGTLATAELPESYFDFVTLWNVLDFVLDPVEQVSAVKRLLVPGGTLVVRVPNLSFHGALCRLTHALPGWACLSGLPANPYIFHPVSFNARTLRQTLKRAGFGEIQIANSLPSYGDPYRTLLWGGDRLLQVAKRSVSGVAWLIAVGSAEKVLWGSSLLATAVKEESPAPALAGGKR